MTRDPLQPLPMPTRSGPLERGGETAKLSHARPDMKTRPSGLEAAQHAAEQGHTFLLGRRSRGKALEI